MLYLLRVMQKSFEKIIPYSHILVSVLLVVAIAYALAQLVLFAIYGDQSQASLTTDINNQTVQATLKTDAKQVDTAQIAQWHLFGEINAKKTPQAPKTTQAPDTKLRLELNGVYLAPEASDSSAIIVEKGEADRYKVGDELPGGVTLHEVYGDRVIIERSGRLETLRFSEKALTSSNNKRTNQASISTRRQMGGGTVLNEIRKGSIRSTKDVMSRLNQNPAEQLSSFINETGLVATESGGYQVSPAAPRDVLASVGLRKGDVINHINGHNLNVIQSDSTLLQEILSSGEAKIEVQRGKRKFTVSYPLP